MPVKTSSDPVTRLTELERARDVAREAEEKARDAHARRLAAIPAARAALTQAVATGSDVKGAEEAFAAAQRAASDPALSARAEGLAQRTRAADVAVQQHLAANFTELVETMRPRAAEVVAAVTERALALRSALDQWSRVSGEVGMLGRAQQWFIPHERIPADPFDKLRSALDQLGEVPLPLPDITVHPAEQAERDRVAAERQVAA
jgi:hypothetical protein